MADPPGPFRVQRTTTWRARLMLYGADAASDAASRRPSASRATPWSAPHREPPRREPRAGHLPAPTACWWARGMPGGRAWSLTGAAPSQGALARRRRSAACDSRAGGGAGSWAPGAWGVSSRGRGGGGGVRGVKRLCSSAPPLSAANTTRCGQQHRRTLFELSDALSFHLCSMEPIKRSALLRPASHSPPALIRPLPPATPAAPPPFPLETTAPSRPRGA
jgi:hypothetical protein